MLWTTQNRGSRLRQFDQFRRSREIADHDGERLIGALLAPAQLAHRSIGTGVLNQVIAAQS